MTHVSEAPSPVTFLFPYREISGVPVLFSRMARRLAEMGTPVDVVDYPDGYMAGVLEGVAGVRVRPFVTGEPCRIPAGTLLVMQSILPATIATELQVAPDTRLFFWTLHPMNLVQAILPFDSVRQLQVRYPAFHRLFGNTVMRRLTKALGHLVTSMHRRGALAFMDGETLDATTSRLNIDLLDPLFLPVPCVVPEANPRRARIPGKALAFTWVGRLGDFKIHILLRTMIQASRFAAKLKQPVVFHVIGNGVDRRRIAKAHLEHDFFRIQEHGIVNGEALDTFLLERTDVLTAMGTSALEGARLGVPTLLLDVSYGPVAENYQFRWIFQSERYTLGRFLDSRCFGPGTDSLERRMEELADDPGRLSRQCFEYCRAHHSLDSVADKFTAAAARASFRWSDMNPDLRRKGAVRSIYERVRARRSAPLAPQSR